MSKRNKPNLKIVAPQFEMQLIAVGGKLVRTYLRDENSLPIRSTKNDRDGWVLHATKGWRRISKQRARAHIGHEKVTRFIKAAFR